MGSTAAPLLRPSAKAIISRCHKAWLRRWSFKCSSVLLLVSTSDVVADVDKKDVFDGRAEIRNRPYRYRLDIFAENAVLRFFSTYLFSKPGLKFERAQHSFGVESRKQSFERDLKRERTFLIKRILKADWTETDHWWVFWFYTLSPTALVLLSH